MTASVAILGGGIAGLTAAYRLQQRGLRPVVFEAEPRLGGRAFTDRLDGFRIDAGAQLVGSMYEHFLALIDELGLADRLVRVPGRDALWRNGKAHEVILGSISSMITSGGLPMSTKMRMGATYAPFLSRNLAHLDQHFPEKAAAAGFDNETIEEWGVREIDTNFVRSLVYPQLAAYYGALPSETSAGFYHILARYGMDVKLFAMSGGIGEVAEALGDAISEGGGVIRLGTPVESVELQVRADGGEVTVVTSQGTEQFAGAVAALPAPVLARTLRGGPGPLHDWLDGVRYRPLLSVALLLDRPGSVRYFGLSFPEGENRYLSTICIQENKRPSLVPEGKGLMLLLPLVEATPSLIDLDSRQVVDRLLPEAAKAFPDLGARVTRARVYRWPVGAPIFPPAYLRHLGAYRDGDIEADFPLAIAGDYLHTPSVEGSAFSGERAAERLYRKLKGDG
jgi:oxygen-dependent protoporphyrinogen oxidase